MTDARPPRFWAWVVEAVLPEEFRETVGDELEALFEQHHRRDPAAARRWYRRQALQGVIPGLQLRLCRPVRTSFGRSLDHGLLPQLRALGALASRSSLLAIRHARDQPLLTVLVVVTLAAAIASSSAALSVVRGVLLEPLPYREPGQLGWVLVDTVSNPDSPFLTGAEYAALLDLDLIEDAAAVTSEFQLRLEGVDRVASSRTLGVTPNIFAVLGVAPLAGAVPAADREDAATVLAWSTWRERLGGSQSAIGTALDLGGRDYRVAAVMPRDFRLPMRNGVGLTGAVDAWLPVEVALQNVRFANFRALVRLRPGASFEQASDAYTAIGRQIAASHPEAFSAEARNYRIVPVHDILREPVRPAIVALTAAVGLLFAAACLNAANLLVARAIRHAPELAIRSALGARRRDMLFESAFESMWLAALAAGIGGWAGSVIVHALLRIDAGNLPRVVDLDLDLGALAGISVLALLATLSAGVVPTLLAGRADPGGSLRSAGTRVLSTGQGRNLLVAIQVAMSLALVIGASLLVRTLANLSAVPLGFNPQQVVVAKVVAPFNRADGQNGFRPFYQGLLTALASRPDIDAVGATTQTPFVEGDAESAGPFRTEEAPELEAGVADLRWTMPGYFAAMQTPLVAGRTFTASEVEEEARVAIVDRGLAERHFPGGDAIGRRVMVPADYDGTPEWVEIVGVVESTRLHGLREPRRVQIYQPLRVATFGVLTVVVRTRAGADFGPRALVDAADELGSRNVFGERELAAIVRDDSATTRLVTSIAGSLAAVALILSLVAIYGLVSSDVARRWGETGLRLALGALPRQVVALHLIAGLRATMVGIVLGIPLALVAASLLRAQLFGVTPDRPSAYIAPVLVSLATATLAALIPARRATQADPASVLRGA